jgi:hypothetical protein
MVDILIEFIIEIAGEALFQIAIELGLELPLSHALRGARKARPLLAAIGIAIMGTASGMIGIRLFPHRLIKTSRWPGLSLVLAPLVAGIVMQLFGSRRRQHGREASSLATFWGGALFALCMSLIRWLTVGRIPNKPI